MQLGFVRKRGKEHVAILNLANGDHNTLFVCSAMHNILDLQNTHIPHFYWPYFAYSAYYTICTWYIKLLYFWLVVCNFCCLFFISFYIFCISFPIFYMLIASSGLVGCVTCLHVFQLITQCAGSRPGPPGPPLHSRNSLTENRGESPFAGPGRCARHCASGYLLL